MCWEMDGVLYWTLKGSDSPESDKQKRQCLQQADMLVLHTLCLMRVEVSWPGSLTEVLGGGEGGWAGLRHSRCPPGLWPLSITAQHWGRVSHCSEHTENQQVATSSP